MNEAAIRHFWARVQKTEACWLWTGTLRPDGYAHIQVDRVRQGVHRWAWEILRGPIPAGMVPDHLCCVRHCVNPTHLEIVTPGENTLRGVGMGARHARQTHCVHGHPFDGANTKIDKRGERVCITCARATALRWYYRQKATA